MNTAPATDARVVPVWATVVDPATEDGHLAVTTWDQRSPTEWAVPANASAGDFVLAWLTGGTGFKYLLQVDGPPREPSGDEAGPRQAMLRLIEPIHPSIPMAQLKAEPRLRPWWLVRSSMQGVLRSQRETLTRDPEWQVFLRLLQSVAPKAAAKVPEGVQQEAAWSAPAARITVSLLDEGSTEVERITVTPALADVLARAAAINDKRSSFDLSFSSLMLALGYGDDSLGKWLADYFTEQGVHLEHALAKVRKTDADARAAARRGMEQRETILAQPLKRTVSARRAFNEAWEMAGARDVKDLDAPYIVAALIGLTDYHEEDFGALSLDRAEWGAALVGYMARQTGDTSDIEFWRRFYTRRFPGRDLPVLEPGRRAGHRPDYDADAYTKTDLLAIDDEVAALASVIASKQTRPPLAIGLFGDWGSGKTFFMKHLRRRIDALCEGARGQKAAERECHAHIAQIEFNAWHYQEGDLWASLVDHILRNLRFGEDEEESKVSERRDQVLRELEATEVRQQAATERVLEADKRKADAEKRVDDLKTKETERRDELARQLTPQQFLTAAREGLKMRGDIRQQAETLAKELGIPAAEQNAVELRDSILEARRELTGVWAFLVPLLRAPDRSRRALLLAVAIGAPILIALFINQLLANYDLLAKLAGLVAGFVSFAVAARDWINRQTKWVHALRTRVEPVARAVNEAVDDGIEVALSQQKEAIAAKIAEIDALRQEQARAEKERAEAAAQAAALRNSLAVLGDDGLMRAFLDDRISGGVYQQKLGVAALVRRDFERLSRKIEQVSERESQNQLKRGELIINRIVLYIDDLDRCEMDKVVPVLRAVHLLMAFPAFVVVVGVDSRWVARCLHKHLPAIFAEEDSESHQAVTPLDYLEKIFQIPIWLEPVSPERRVFMARTLLRKPEAAKTPAPVPAAPPDGETKPRTKDHEDLNRDDTRDRVKEMAKGESEQPADDHPAGATQVEPTDGVPLDLNPRGLSISDAELAFLGDLGGLLSSSPRVIKRFVNTYRLINVAMAQAGLEDVNRQPRDAEIRMLLLAVLVGMPDFSRWLQAALRDTEANLAITPFVDVMDESREKRFADVAAGSSAEHELAQWQRVLQWITDRGEPWTTMPAARVSEWLSPVGRYTFNLSRETTNRQLARG